MGLTSPFRKLYIWEKLHIDFINIASKRLRRISFVNPQNVLMKHKIFTLIVVIGVMHFSSDGQPGTLDRSFGSYGEVIFYGYPEWDFIYTGAIAIQADGKIVET